METRRGMLSLLLLFLLTTTSFAIPSRVSPTITPAPTLPGHIRPSCYTHTTTVPYTGLLFCPIHTSCLSTPICEVPETTTEFIAIPCHNSHCLRTPTVTVTGPGYCPHCVTECEKVTATRTRVWHCPMETA